MDQKDASVAAMLEALGYGAAAEVVRGGGGRAVTPPRQETNGGGSAPAPLWMTRLSSSASLAQMKYVRGEDCANAVCDAADQAANNSDKWRGLCAMVSALIDSRSDANNQGPGSSQSFPETILAVASFLRLSFPWEAPGDDLTEALAQWWDVQLSAEVGANALAEGVVRHNSNVSVGPTLNAIALRQVIKARRGDATMNSSTSSEPFTPEGELADAPSVDSLVAQLCCSEAAVDPSASACEPHRTLSAHSDISETDFRTKSRIAMMIDGIGIAFPANAKAAAVLAVLGAAEATLEGLTTVLAPAVTCVLTHLLGRGAAEHATTRDLIEGAVRRALSSAVEPGGERDRTTVAAHSTLHIVASSRLAAEVAIRNITTDHKPPKSSPAKSSSGRRSSVSRSQSGGRASRESSTSAPPVPVQDLHHADDDDGDEVIAQEMPRNPSGDRESSASHEPADAPEAIEDDDDDDTPERQGPASQDEPAPSDPELQLAEEEVEEEFGEEDDPGVEEDVEYQEEQDGSEEGETQRGQDDEGRVTRSALVRDTGVEWMTVLVDAWSRPIVCGVGPDSLFVELMEPQQNSPSSVAIKRFQYWGVRTPRPPLLTPVTDAGEQFVVLSTVRDPHVFPAESARVLDAIPLHQITTKANNTPRKANGTPDSKARRGTTSLVDVSAGTDPSLVDWVRIHLHAHDVADPLAIIDTRALDAAAVGTANDSVPQRPRGRPLYFAPRLPIEYLTSPEPGVIDRMRLGDCAQLQRILLASVTSHPHADSLIPYNAHISQPEFHGIAFSTQLGVIVLADSNSTVTLINANSYAPRDADGSPAGPHQSSDVILSGDTVATPGAGDLVPKPIRWEAIVPSSTQRDQSGRGAVPLRVGNLQHGVQYTAKRKRTTAWDQNREDTEIGFEPPRMLPCHARAVLPLGVVRHQHTRALTQYIVSELQRGVRENNHSLSGVTSGAVSDSTMLTMERLSAEYRYEISGVALSPHAGPSLATLEGALGSNPPEGGRFAAFSAIRHPSRCFAAAALGGSEAEAKQLQPAVTIPGVYAVLLVDLLYGQLMRSIPTSPLDPRSIAPKLGALPTFHLPVKFVFRSAARSGHTTPRSVSSGRQCRLSQEQLVIAAGGLDDTVYFFDVNTGTRVNEWTFGDERKSQRWQESRRAKPTAADPISAVATIPDTVPGSLRELVAVAGSDTRAVWDVLTAKRSFASTRLAAATAAASRANFSENGHVNNVNGTNRLVNGNGTTPRRKEKHIDVGNSSLANGRGSAVMTPEARQKRIDVEPLGSVDSVVPMVCTNGNGSEVLSMLVCLNRGELVSASFDVDGDQRSSASHNPVF